MNDIREDFKKKLTDPGFYNYLIKVLTEKELEKRKVNIEYEVRMKMDPMNTSEKKLHKKMKRRMEEKKIKIRREINLKIQNLKYYELTEDISQILNDYRILSDIEKKNLSYNYNFSSYKKSQFLIIVAAVLLALLGGAVSFFILWSSK